MKVVVIIPAAGLGTRMSPASDARSKKPVASKQFSEIGGTPILIHTLRKFAASPEVAEIYVALRANEMAGFQTRLKADKELSASKIELVEAASTASSRWPMRWPQSRRRRTILSWSTMRSAPS